MPEPVYYPVKFFSVDTSEEQEFITDEEGEIVTDEDGEPLTPG